VFTIRAVSICHGVFRLFRFPEFNEAPHVSNGSVLELQLDQIDLTPSKRDNEER
jgi:hypothetical protein